MCRGGGGALPCPAYCRMFSIISGLYPSDGGSRAPFPPRVKAKTFPYVAGCPLEGRIVRAVTKCADRKEGEGLEERRHKDDVLYPRRECVCGLPESLTP